MRSQATIPRCCRFQGSEDDKPTKLITSVRGRWCDFLRRLKKHLPPYATFPRRPTNGVVSLLHHAPSLSPYPPPSSYARCMKKRGKDVADEGIGKDYSKDYSGLALSRVLLAGRLARISLDLISFWPGRLREAAVAPRVERTTAKPSARSA